MTESPPYFHQATRKQTEDFDSKFYNEAEDLQPEIDINKYFLSYVKDQKSPVTLGEAIDDYIAINNPQPAIEKSKKKSVFSKIISKIKKNVKNLQNDKK